MRKLSKILPIFIILLISIIFFGKVIFTGKVLLPADMLLKELPWRYYSDGNTNIQNHYLNDVISVLYPWKVFTSKQLKSIRFPLWAPEAGCGYPLFANGYPNFMSISGLLLLLFDVNTAHNLLFIIQLFLAGVFMYIYLRTIRLGIFAALVGAIAFMLNFLFMAHLLFEHVVGGVIWLPLIFLFLEKFHSKGSYVYLCLAGLFTGIAILNGSIQSMLYVFLAVFIYFAYHAYYAIRAEKSVQLLFKRTLFFSLIILIGLSVAAVKLIPTFEFLLGWNERSGRFTLGTWLATLWKKPLIIPLFSGFIFPDLIGSHRALDATKILGGMGGGERISGDLFKAYIGIFPFIFAIIAVFYRKCEKTKLFTWMAIIPILLILFTPFYLVLYFRGFVIYAFAASVLAGLGADWLINSENRRAAIERINKGFKWVLIIGFVILVVGNIFLYAFKDKIVTAGHEFMRVHIASAGWFNYDVDWQLNKVDNMVAYYNIFNHRMYLPFLIGALCLVLLWGFGRGKIGKTIFMAIVIPIIFFDLARLGWDYIPMVDKSLVFPETESVKFLKQDKSLFRVASTWDRMKDPPVFPPNTLLPYGISDIKVYESLVPKVGFMEEQFYDLLNVKYVLVPPDTQMPENKYQLVFDKDIWIYENKEVLPRAYIVPQAKFVKTEGEALREVKKISFDPKNIVVIQGQEDFNIRMSEHSGRETLQGSNIQITNYEPERVVLDVNMTDDGFLILSDRYYPGWKAVVDGLETPIYKANYVFRSLYLKNGAHHIEFRFEPLSFRIGVYISLAVIVLLLLISLIMLRWDYKFL